MQDGTAQGWDLIPYITGSYWGFEEEKHIIISDFGEEDQKHCAQRRGDRRGLFILQMSISIPPRATAGTAPWGG